MSPFIQQKDIKLNIQAAGTGQITTFDCSDFTISSTPTNNYTISDNFISTTGLSNFSQTLTIDVTAFQTFQTAMTNVQLATQKLATTMGTPWSTMRPLPGFNKYLNGSDLLEEFIKFLGEQGVRQSEVANIPVESFIRWLVIRACEEDEEEPPVVLELPAPIPQPRCLGCQRFMAKATVLPMHDQRCSDLYFARQLVAA